MPKHPTHVEQALAEVDNAERLGSVEHLLAAEKRLAAAGHKRAEAAHDVEQARSVPPRGRSARQPVQTDQDTAKE